MDARGAIALTYIITRNLIGARRFGFVKQGMHNRRKELLHPMTNSVSNDPIVCYRQWFRAKSKIVLIVSERLSLFSCFNQREEKFRKMFRFFKIRIEYFSNKEGILFVFLNGKVILGIIFRIFRTINVIMMIMSVRSDKFFDTRKNVEKNYSNSNDQIANNIYFCRFQKIKIIFKIIIKANFKNVTFLKSFKPV